MNITPAGRKFYLAGALNTPAANFLPDSMQENKGKAEKLEKNLIEFIVKFGARKKLFKDGGFRERLGTAISNQDCGNAVSYFPWEVEGTLDDRAGLFSSDGITIKNLLVKLKADNALYKKIDDALPSYEKLMSRWPKEWQRIGHKRVKIAEGKLNELADDLIKKIEALKLPGDYIILSGDLKKKYDKHFDEEKVTIS